MARGFAAQSVEYSVLPSTSCCVTVQLQLPSGGDIQSRRVGQLQSLARSNSRARRAAPFTFCDGVRTGHQQYSDWYKRARAGLRGSEARAQMHQVRTRAAPPFTTPRAVHPTSQLTTRVLHAPVCACIQHQTSQLTRSRAALVGPRRSEAHSWRYHSTTTLHPTNKALQIHDKSPARAPHSNALCIPHRGSSCRTLTYPTRTRQYAMSEHLRDSALTQTADSAD